MTEKKQEKTITADEARQTLAEMRNQRLQACNAAIQQALRTHACRLVAVPDITEDGRIIASVQIREANG